jgi:very-short-patch-repair endonuclease
MNEDLQSPAVNGAVSNKEIYKKLHPEALRMRTNPTNAEDILWNELNSKKLGYKFRRQHIIDKFIVDFYCVDKGLIIEVDGEIHDEQKERDVERDNVLRSLGCNVLRFTNQQIHENLNAVIEEIKVQLNLT